MSPEYGCSRIQMESSYLPNRLHGVTLNLTLTATVLQLSQTQRLWWGYEFIHSECRFRVSLSRWRNLFRSLLTIWGNCDSHVRRRLISSKCSTFKFDLISMQSRSYTKPTGLNLVMTPTGPSTTEFWGTADQKLQKKLMDTRHVTITATKQSSK
jgi:hypothetical protein